MYTSKVMAKVKDYGEKITDSRLYKINFNNPKYNWLDKNKDEVIDKIKDYLVNMETITI